MTNRPFAHLSRAKDEPAQVRALLDAVGADWEFLGRYEHAEDLPQHRWSGWPGAWCLDCGAEDANERDLAGVDGPPNGPCPEPGSRNHDPYYHPATE
jgi:hypothetical protein